MCVLGLAGRLKALKEVCVHAGVHEAREGVSLHEHVDLLLRLVKRAGGGLLHVAVDHFTHTRVQAHLDTQT